MKKLILIAIFLFTPLVAFGQTTCPDGSQCVKQATIDAAVAASVELLSARRVIAAFTLERGATDAERASAARLIDRLNAVISTQDRLVGEYTAVIALYKSVVAEQAALIERLQKMLNAPKSAFQKLVGILKTIATLATGILIGRAGI